MCLCWATPLSGASLCIKSFPLFASLHFLLPFIKHFASKTNIGSCHTCQVHSDPFLFIAFSFCPEYWDDDDDDDDEIDDDDDDDD